MRAHGKVAALVALCAALSLGAVAAPARAAIDPLFVYTPPASVPPGSGFDGPCGLAVDIAGNFYVSDYYHHVVDIFGGGTSPAYKTQVKAVDPLDGPCGLAIDASGKLYVNDYHRSVIRYTPAAYPPGSNTAYAAGPTLSSEHPTGVAVDPAGFVWVDERTQLAAYDPTTAAPVLDDEDNPIEIDLGSGSGSGSDGYGLAAAAGRLYVADAATNTVKAYDTATGELVLTITGPPGGFSSLLDSALAVDRVSGDVYVADRRSSPFTERPESTIQVFDSTGAYKGHLKFNVVDAAPVGLAVDNSVGANQGRVYVTSGNTSGASVYAYTKEAATTATPLPASTSVTSTSGAVVGKVAARAPGAAGPPTPPPASASEASQSANLRLDVNGSISPKRLPRKGAAPIAVEVGWNIATTDGAPPPKLRTLSIEINRAGRFDLEGLPTCPYAKIQPASTSRALANCRSALVGRGSFQALIALAGQESYVTKGQMLVFNGLQGKKPVLYGQIYSANPFANSFVIPFRLKEITKGRYGTSLIATLPASLRAWGSLTEIQMRLKRSFGYHGTQHSFISAGCPAPKGFPGASFPLARTSFGFVGGESQSLILTRSCKARG